MKTPLVLIPSYAFLASTIAARTCTDRDKNQILEISNHQRKVLFNCAKGDFWHEIWNFDEPNLKNCYCSAGLAADLTELWDLVRACDPSGYNADVIVKNLDKYQRNCGHVTTSTNSDVSMATSEATSRNHMTSILLPVMSCGVVACINCFL